MLVAVDLDDSRNRSLTEISLLFDWAVTAASAGEFAYESEQNPVKIK